MSEMNDIKNKIYCSIKDNYIIIIILLIAFGIRWYGIYFDYPYGVTSIGDEGRTMQFLMDAINNKNIFAASSSYPVLMAFFYLPVLIIRIIYLALVNNLHSFEEIKGFIIGHGIGQIYIISRWFSVFLGTASVYFIYKIYSLIFKYKSSAYYAAFVYTFSLIPVVLSHWGKLHAPMAFFFLMSLFFILKFETEKKEKYFFWSAVGAAMSFSSHYIGIMSFVFIFIGFLINRKEISVKIIMKSLAGCIFIFLIAFAVDYKGIYIMLSSQYYDFLAPNNFTGLFPVGKLERFYYGLLDIFKIEPIFFVLFFVMLIANFRRYYKNKLIRYILAGLLISYLLLLGVAGAHLSRWLLIFITLSITLAAGTLAEYLLDKKIKKIAVYIILTLLLLPNIFFVSRWLMLLQKNTRQEAIEWSRNNVKTNEFIYNFDNWFDAPLTYEAIAWDKQFNQRFSKKQDYILEHPDVIKNTGAINLIYDYNNERFKELAGEKTKYVLIAYWVSGDKQDYYEFPTRKDSYKLIDKVKEHHNLKLVKTFFPTTNEQLIKNGVDDYFNSPHSWLDLLYLGKGGPFIEIYEIY